MSNQLITEITSRLINKQPFFASYLLTHMKIVEFDRGIAATDGATIWINPEEFRKLLLSQQMFILCHEVLHGIYGHMSRGKAYAKLGTINGLPYDHSLMNDAEDYVINDALLEVDGLERPPMGLFNYHYKCDMSAEEVYAKLYQYQPPQGGSGGEGEGSDEDGDEPSPGSGQPSGSTGSGFDEHVVPADAVPAPSEQEVKQRMVQSMNAARAMGNLPGVIERIITGLVEPKVDWKEQLRATVSASLGKDNLTWARPNRRKLAFPDFPIMPGRQGSRVGKLAVIVDTSGSISQEELQAFLGEIGGMIDETHPEDCRVFWTDSKVAGVDIVETADELLSLTPKGGGGTNLESAFPVIEEEMGTADVTAVMLTDGYTNWDERPPFDIVIVSTTESKPAPYGTNIYLET